MDAAGSRLILASGSPRRRALLEDLGLRFQVRSVAIDETPLAGEAAETYVRRLAEAKARERCGASEVVIGADTVVVLDSVILGKPRDETEARQMLERLSGRWHEVLSGIAVCSGDSGDPQRCTVAVARTEVRIAPLSDQEIRWYAATGEGSDKAGSYGAQGLGGLFIEQIRGSHSNVVGLPIPDLYRLFQRAGLDVRSFR